MTRVYNGCGILVGQMRTGQKPDLYFACDPRFMGEVADLFLKPETVSNNQLVIAVLKGNPAGLKELKDLGKEGLRVGVGHEQQCALGAITQRDVSQVRRLRRGPQERESGEPDRATCSSINS